MKKIMLVSSIFIVISLIIGCTPASNEMSSSSNQDESLTATLMDPTRTPLPKFSDTPEITLTPTITPTIAPTLTPTITPYLYNLDAKTINDGNIAQLVNYQTIGKGSISSFIFSGDKEQLLVQTSRGLWLYDTESLKEINFFENYAYYKVLSDGLTFATISPSQHVEIIEFSSGSTLKSIEIDNVVYLGNVFISRDGGLLAVSVVQPHKTRQDYYSNRIDVFDLTNSELIARLESDVVGSCSRFAISDDGTQLISSCSPSGGGLSRLINWSIPDETISWALISSESFPEYPFSPDGTYISTNTSSQTIIRSALYSDEVNRVPGQLSSNAFSPDSHYFVTSSFELIRLWYVTNPEQDEAIQSGLSWPAVAFSEDGEYIVANGGEKAWRVSDMTLDESYQGDKADPILDMSRMREIGHLSNISGIEVLSDDTLLIWGYTYEGILWWMNPDRNSYDEMFIENGTGQPALSPSFDQIAICTADGLELIDLDDQETRIVTQCRSGYSYLAYAKDEKTIFLNWGIVINQIDLESGELIHQLVGHSYNIGKIIISDDGKLLFSISSGPTGSGFEAAIWQTDPVTLLQKWTIPSQQGLKDAAFTVDGEELIAITNEIYVWRVSDGWYLKNIQGTTMGLSPDGSLAAVSKGFGGFDFYQTSDWKLINLSQEENYVIPSGFPSEAYLNYISFLMQKASFIADGKLLFTIDNNDVIELWKVP